MQDTISHLAAIGVDIDPTLKRLCGDVDLLVSLLQDFAAENLVAQIPDALEKQDYEAIENLAHAVKGTSGNLGLVDLSARCNDVVQAVRSGNTELLGSLVEATLVQNQQALAGIATL